MIPHNLILTFLSLNNGQVVFEVAEGPEQAGGTYHPEEDLFSFEGNGRLPQTLADNEFQLQKVVRSALKGKPEPGQEVPFVFIENFPFLKNEDFARHIRIDQRGADPLITVSPDPTNGICKLYTDGSYTTEAKHSGYAGIIEDTDGNKEIFRASFAGGSSNLMELMAVAEGLERLSAVEKLRIYTDSRFVIRGLAQWIHFWRLNNWQMAYGRKVSYAEQWQRLDRLSRGRFLEVKWLSHNSGDPDHALCHRMAKEMATKGLTEL